MKYKMPLQEDCKACSYWDDWNSECDYFGWCPTRERVEREEMDGMKENRIVESLCQVDFSELSLPLVTIYEKPLDFPDAFVARVWDGKGAKPTNTMIKRDTIQEIREDIMAAGFMTVFQRAEDDAPHIVETWM